MNNEMTANNMSNEETIEVLKGIVFGGFDRTTPKEREALDVAIEALKGKIWIPTSEMLPEEYDSYLVMWRRRDRYSDRLFYEIVEYYPADDEGEGEWEQIEQAGKDGAEIVAWMPLPEMYEPKGETK